MHFTPNTTLRGFKNFWLDEVPRLCNIPELPTTYFNTWYIASYQQIFIKITNILNYMDVFVSRFLREESVYIYVYIYSVYIYFHILKIFHGLRNKETLLWKRICHCVGNKVLISIIGKQGGKIWVELVPHHKRT